MRVCWSLKAIVTVTPESGRVSVVFTTVPLIVTVVAGGVVVGIVGVVGLVGDPPQSIANSASSQIPCFMMLGCARGCLSDKPVVWFVFIEKDE